MGLDDETELVSLAIRYLVVDIEYMGEDKCLD